MLVLIKIISQNNTYSYKFFMANDSGTLSINKRLLYKIKEHKFSVVQKYLKEIISTEYFNDLKYE